MNRDKLMTRSVNRRTFVQTVALGAAAACTAGAPGTSEVIRPKAREDGPSDSRVSLIKGNDRRQNLIKALEVFSDDIRTGIGDRQVVIKPNLTRVGKEDQLASTHVDALRAICHVVSASYKGKIIIAEGTGPGAPIEEAVRNFGYDSLAKDYNVEFVDLRNDKYAAAHVIDRDMRPVPILLSNLLCDPSNYVISAAVMKTHTLAAVTLALKNIVMAMPMNFGGRNNERRKMHSTSVSEDPRPFHYNLYQLAQLRVPDLAVIDGFVGMQGEGPLNGDPVESKVALVGTDWLAADRVATEVMGFDFSRIGHYRYCAESHMGEAELSNIRIVGDSIANCRSQYNPPSTLDKILI